MGSWLDRARNVRGVTGTIMFLEVSRRLERWIKNEFAAGSAERVLGELRALPDVSVAVRTALSGYQRRW
jgi:hypothetical protein